jgi:hypothetical protein
MMLTNMQLDVCIKINTKCKLKLCTYDILRGSNLNSHQGFTCVWVLQKSELSSIHSEQKQMK